MFVFDFVEDEGKFLYCGDDDFFVVFDKLVQVVGVFCMVYCGGDLGKLFDGVVNLLVQYLAIGYNDDGVEQGFVILFQFYQLMSKLGNRVIFIVIG